ncbi:MAG: hypothetical protein HFJ54_06560 [Clostridia bacterium]|nr:hypothetical protein [Clostridia bacterium]
MKNTNENSILKKLDRFLKMIFNRKKKLELPDKTQSTVSSTNKLEYIKIDTDAKMNDLKVSLENGYKKISELSNKELDELILIYKQDVKKLEDKLIYKKSLL